MKDLHNKIKISRAISPVSVSDNTAQVSQIIDRQGYESLEFIIGIGSVADADATFAVTMDEGDVANLSDASAVAAADLLGSYTDASFQFDSDNTVKKIGYRGSKRYVRLTITPSSNASAAVFGATAVQGHAAQNPTS
jgi:hypothetical protein